MQVSRKFEEKSIFGGHLILLQYFFLIFFLSVKDIFMYVGRSKHLYRRSEWVENCPVVWFSLIVSIIYRLESRQIVR